MESNAAALPVLPKPNASAFDHSHTVFHAFVPVSFFESEPIDDKSLEVSFVNWDLFPGCFVRRSKQTKSDEIGFCKETQMKLTLRTLDTNDVIENVDRSDFVPLSTINFGTLFLFHSWIGKVVKIKQQITVKTDDGSVAVVGFEDIIDFVELAKEKARFYVYDSFDRFSIGKQFTGPKNSLKKFQWSSLTDDLKKILESESGAEIKITISDVAISEIKVQWLYCISEESVPNDAQSSSSTSLKATREESKHNLYRVTNNIASNGLKSPPKFLKGNDLLEIKSLNFIANKLKARIDWVGYYLKNLDFPNGNHSATTSTNSFDNYKINVSGVISKSESSEVLNEEDVNQNVSQFVSSDSNHSASVVKRKNSSPEYSLKNKRIKPTSSTVPDLGIPVKIIGMKTLATVLWQNNKLETDIESSSLYPSNYFMEGEEVFPGKFVVKADNMKDEYGVIQNVNYSEKTAYVKWFRKMDLDKENQAPQFIQDELVSTYDIKNDPKLCFWRGASVFKITKSDSEPKNYMKRVGQVINPWCDGKILCGWADGTQSFVYPQELFHLSNVSVTEPKETTKTVKKSSSELNVLLPKIKMHKIAKYLEGIILEDSQALKETLDTINEEEEESDILEIDNEPKCETGSLKTLESVPMSHRFYQSKFEPNSLNSFTRRVRKEIMILQSSIPPSISVITFEDRLDLFSVMIKGPKATPYEDGLFFFDIQLPSNYPHVPPVVHYYSFCSKRLNPNLYEDGLVCLSLLGTWTGSGTELWSSNSNLLQLLLSIQSLILVDEPYFNEPGFVRQKGTEIGGRKSKLYNEMVVLKLMQSMCKLIQHPIEIFAEEIREHFRNAAKSFIARLETWINLSKSTEESNDAEKSTSSNGAEFPLLPCSQGFCISLKREILNFQQMLQAQNILSLADK
ncbi:hypothetical protein B4U79_09866 [Dinothrombium tinctorium]|uniref:UBC core domain-containing protein n=1 Tax=Dinothrombium tinctorium TaxID=1965070 RepID=A0A3S3QAY5_9ACAR|nr:hypothetical protein B4U79_09866 [Dinothrombium tinctorium]